VGASAGQLVTPASARLHGIIGFLLTAQRGERNRLLFWASLRAVAATIRSGQR
jgi:hypothetical protein